MLEPSYFLLHVVVIVAFLVIDVQIDELLLDLSYDAETLSFESFLKFEDAIVYIR